MDNSDFDLFVIGGGSGGVRAARVAARYGARVALAEENRIGGTCVIRGCIPKKFMVYASRYADDFKDARGYGWDITPPSFNWSHLIEAKNKELKRLESLYLRGLEEAGVTIFMERAQLEGPNSVRITSGPVLSAKKVLIATGGQPYVDHDIGGIENAITSNDVFELQRQPNNIFIVGGGYIALEFASIFSNLGSKVTVLCRGEKVLRGFDTLLRDGVTEALCVRGVNFITKDRLKNIRRTKEYYSICTHGGLKQDAEQILFAIGRLPNTKGLRLDTVGVKLNSEGGIITNAHSCSNVQSIFAVGDVANKKNLTPLAIQEAQAFSDSQFGKKPWSVNYSNIPTAVFSTPEVGSVGLTEEEARGAFSHISIYETSFRPLRYVLAQREEKTLMKLIVEQKTDRILGVHILGPDAAEIIQMATIALNLGATKTDFDKTIALHPTAAEELVTLRIKR